MLVKDVMRIGQRKLTNGDLGIEIEVEGRNLPRPGDMWRCERDGSLRGDESMEYVLAKPSTIEQVTVALDNLDHSYVQTGSRVDESVRAGVHVHVNCQKLSMKQLYTFMVLYITLENVLLKFCGEWREGNLFCLRCQDAEYLLTRLIAATRNKDYVGEFQDNNVRYSSMNVKALGDYGSLEFRAMRSTRDLSLILTWAKMLLHLREVSKRFVDPVEVVQKVSQLGGKAFLELCLGEHAKLFANVKSVEELLFDGVRLSQCVAYCTDWDAFDEPRMIGGVPFPDDGNFYEEPLGDM